MDHESLDAGGHFEAVVLDILAGPAEDRVQQFLLGRQLAARLGRYLADEDVARPDIGAHLNNAVLVEIGQGLGRHVRDIAGKLFLAEFRFANLDLELLDVDRRVGIILDEFLANDDRVFEVIAVPCHERDQHVSPERQLAVVRGGPVGDDLAFLDLLADLDDRLLIEASTLVEADELAQRVLTLVDANSLRIDVGDGAVFLGPDDHAAVDGHVFFQAGAHQRRLRDQQRHRLPLHVRAHKRAVGVVVFQERDQARGYANHLLG